MFGLSYSADVYYPRDLYNEYKNLQVQCDANFVSVSVNQYRNLKDGLEKGLQLKAALNDVTKGQARRACGDPFWMDVFSGKGSPGCITTTLEFVYAYRDQLMRSYSGWECAQVLAKHKSSSPKVMLQAISDKYIGLDCNGFVGNFVKLINPKIADLGANTPIDRYYPRRVALRNTVDEVDIMDLLIWREYHIAIVDNYQWIDGQWRFSVAQSTGGGPQIHLHKLTAKGKGRFTFHTVHSKQVGGDCYIVSAGLY